MTTQVSDWSPPATAGGDWVVTPDGARPLADVPAAGLGHALDVLIAQEIRGERRERVPDRVADLLDRFGFGWEPLSEPGHMRTVGDAADLLVGAQRYAAATAAATFRDLDIPWTALDGVNVVDATAPVVADYMALTSGTPGLYGEAPYAVAGERDGYVLRQTSCFQKYSVCRDHRLARTALPVALFEISDSYRREPLDVLQLSYRLRRFHLPEAHVHAADVAAAVETAHLLHRHILGVLAGLDVAVVLLVTASREFVGSHRDFVDRLVRAAGVPALLRVGAAGELCQDGVEVDVEYKVIDSTGACRELSTFQIDREITRRFGVRCDDGTHPATIHTVLTGGVERYLYTAFDRVARGEAEGAPRHLPLWLAPVHARVLSDGSTSGSALGVAEDLARAGLRVEFDDRGHDPGRAVADAAARLVPVVVTVGVDRDGGTGVRVREHAGGDFRDTQVAELVSMLGAGAVDTGRVRRLSRGVFADECSPRR